MKALLPCPFARGIAAGQLTNPLCYAHRGRPASSSKRLGLKGTLLFRYLLLKTRLQIMEDWGLDVLCVLDRAFTIIL